MKEERKAAIRQILKETEIQTQKDLARALRERGFQVTQATVSRDMKEMRLTKAPGPGGVSRYVEPEYPVPGLDQRMIRLLRECVILTEAAGQMVVVKTMSGAAGTAAEALDALEMDGILGSIAGDNTIFLAARDSEAAAAARETIRNYLK